MCFDAKTSLFTFVLGTVGSLLLIKYGNPQFKKENLIFGIFLLFISSVQFMDFLIWMDLPNKVGINRLATIIGPLLNKGQPIILWIIKLRYFKPDIWSSSNLPITLLNGAYAINLIWNYVKFIVARPNNLITGIKNGHLHWAWLQPEYINPWFYLLLFAINIFYLTNWKYSLLFFAITYFFFFLSVTHFSYNIGELWCFFGAFIPIIMFFLTRRLF